MGKRSEVSSGERNAGKGKAFNILRFFLHLRFRFYVFVKIYVDQAREIMFEDRHSRTRSRPWTHLTFCVRAQDQTSPERRDLGKSERLAGKTGSTGSLVDYF